MTDGPPNGDDDSGDGDNDENRSFNQNRKAAAEACKPQIREILKEWYDEPDHHVHNVESEKDGAYEPGEKDTTNLIDFCGIDWLVQTEGTIIGVGQRIRKDPDGWRDMTLRCANGSGTRSERDMIPAGIERGGFYPRDYLLAVREAFNVHRAVLIDTEVLLDGIKQGRIREKGPFGNADGTRYSVQAYGAMADFGAIKEVWLE